MHNRVGFIVCGVHAKANDALGRSMLDDQLVEDAFNALRKRGLDIYRIKGILSREEEFEESLKEIQDQNVDCAIFFVATWLWASEIWKVARNFSKPILIWCAPTPVGWPTGGAFVLHGALDEIGVKHKLVYGYPHDEQTLKKIVSYVRAAGALIKLRNSKMAIVGGYGMGAVTGSVDIAQVLSKFGVKIEHVDQYELANRAGTFSSEEVQRTYGKLNDRFVNLPKLDRIMERSIRLYLALRSLAAERKFDVMAVKCFPELGDNYATPCLGQSLLPEEGIVSSCIGDVNTALSAYILHLLSGEPTFNPDIQKVNKDEGVVNLASDGAAPVSLAADPNNVVLKNRGLVTEGAADGISVGFICKPGSVTMIRLCRIKGDYYMHLALGEAYIPKDVEKLVSDTGFPHWPHAFIKLKGDAEDFIQNQRSEYISMCYGSYKEELIDLCDLLDTKLLLTS